MNWYGFIIACGILICVVAAYFVAIKRGIEGDLVVDIILFCLPLAIFGARLYYVIFDIVDGGSWTFARFFGWENGKFTGFEGLAIYGGLIGAVIGAVILWLIRNRKKVPAEKRISFPQMLDLGFVFIILGQSIGRWGNFTNQEAHGYLITNASLMWFPMGVEIGGNWYYATFFYESMWNLIGFAVLMFLYIGKFKSFDGFIFSLYCIYYGIGRTWIEGMRSDSLWLIPPTVAGQNGMPDVGGVRVSQLLSILLILGGLAYIIQHIVRAIKAKKKIFICVDQANLCDKYFEYEKTKLAHPMPDLDYFWKKKKKNADAENISVDENGVVIVNGYETVSNDPEKLGNTEKKELDGKQAKAIENKQIKQIASGQSEVKESGEQYEDRWDD